MDDRSQKIKLVHTARMQGQARDTSIVKCTGFVCKHTHTHTHTHTSDGRAEGRHAVKVHGDEIRTRLLQEVLVPAEHHLRIPCCRPGQCLRGGRVCNHEWEVALSRTSTIPECRFQLGVRSCEGQSTLRVSSICARTTVNLNRSPVRRFQKSTGRGIH